jgi:hypothetical protein
MIFLSILLILKILFVNGISNKENQFMTLKFTVSNFSDYVKKTTEYQSELVMEF